MKLSLPNAVTSRFARQILVVEKHSPQLLFGTGIVLMGATVVSACKATLKLNDELDIMHQQLEMVDSKIDLDDKRRKKLATWVYTRNVARVAKLYAPAAIFGSLSVAALTGSHHILNKRNAGLSAALAATDRALRDYRARVSEELGEEKELEVYRGVTTETVPVLDDEGRETKSKKKVTQGGGKSPYATWWGRDTSKDWNYGDEGTAYNLAFLTSQREFANARLRAKGHLFLNDVYDALGLQRTPMGSQVGWLWEQGTGDDFVDFGIHNTEGDRFLDFVTGREDGIWLDFNVDGEIWEKI